MTIKSDLGFPEWPWFINQTLAYHALAMLARLFGTET